MQCPLSVALGSSRQTHRSIMDPTQPGFRIQGRIQGRQHNMQQGITCGAPHWEESSQHSLQGQTLSLPQWEAQCERISLRGGCRSHPGLKSHITNICNSTLDILYWSQQGECPGTSPCKLRKSKAMPPTGFFNSFIVLQVQMQSTIRDHFY